MGDSRASRRNWPADRAPLDKEPWASNDGKPRDSLASPGMSLDPSRRRALRILRQSIGRPSDPIAIESGLLQNADPRAGLHKPACPRRLVVRNEVAYQTLDGLQFSGAQAKRCLIFLLVATLTTVDFCLCHNSPIDQNDHYAHHKSTGATQPNCAPTNGRHTDLRSGEVSCAGQSSKLKVMSAGEGVSPRQPQEILNFASNNSLDRPGSMAILRDDPRPAASPAGAAGGEGQLARPSQLGPMRALSTQLVPGLVGRDLELVPAASGDSLELMAADSKKKKKMMKKKKKMEKKHKEWKKGKKHKKVSSYRTSGRRSWKLSRCAV